MVYDGDKKIKNDGNSLTEVSYELGWYYGISHGNLLCRIFMYFNFYEEDEVVRVMKIDLPLSSPCM